MMRTSMTGLHQEAMSLKERMKRNTVIFAFVALFAFMSTESVYAQNKDTTSHQFTIISQKTTVDNSGYLSGFKDSGRFDKKQKGWVTKGKNKYYYDSKGKKVTGSKKIGKYYYYFNKSGVMLKGWRTSGSNKYYYDTNGRMVTGAKKISGFNYYFNSKGVMLKGWRTSGSNKYYYDAKGRMVTGAKTIDGFSYFFNTNGTMFKGWRTSGSNKYYYDTNGRMITGTKTIDGFNYFFNTNGTMSKGWRINGIDRYYYDTNGHMLYGNQTIGNAKYYIGFNGVAVTGWRISGNDKYYHDVDGKMVTGAKTIEGYNYFFNTNGTMFKGWRTSGSNKYYYDENGHMLTGSQNINNKTYYFNNSGVMMTGWQTVNGKQYYFDKDGVMEISHDFSDWKVEKQVTCTTNGLEKRTCKECGTEETRTVAAIGHQFSDWKVEKAATCTKTGLEVRICQTCQIKETKTIAVIKHQMSDWKVEKAATCTENGLEVKICQICQMKETRTLNALGHDFGEWTVKTKATCAAPGMDERKCTREGCGKIEYRNTDIVEHQIVQTSVEPATCTTREKINSQCTVCGQKFFSYKGQALGHEYADEYTVDKAPTCTTSGSESRHCIHEGCTSTTGSRTVAATGHQFGDYIIDKNATCTDVGQRHRECQACGYSTKGKQDELSNNTIKALGHNFSKEFTVDKEATCNTYGTKSRHCLNDGCTQKTDVQQIPYKEHQFGEQQVVKEATCLEDGNATQTCQVCGYVKDVKIPSAGQHTWGKLQEEEISKCVGTMQYKTCQICGEKQYEEALVPGTGHRWSSTNNVEAKCLDCGIKAPSWTNAWAKENYDEHGKYAPKDPNEPERIRIVWYVAYQADTTMSEGFKGKGYYLPSTVITADYVYTQKAPTAKEGYEFVGWYNAGTDTLVTEDTTLKATWKDMNVVFEAKYQAVVNGVAVEEVSDNETPEAAPESGFGVTEMCAIGVIVALGSFVFVKKYRKTNT